MKNLIILILYILISWPIASLATSTNVNEVTDLFDKHIEGKQELLHNLEEQNNNAISQIKSGVHHDSIEGIGDAEVKASELGSIKETELDNAGRAKRASGEYQFYDENELEPDYTKPGNRLHKEDSDDIVSSTDDTMHKIGSNFMAKLNSEGFDCKTVKGSVVKEPTYYIEIKRENQNNTEYDQVFCEEPRNTYNCNDNLKLSCKTLGWNNWQKKRIKLLYQETPESWWTDYQLLQVHYERRLRYITPDKYNEIANFIANKLKVSKFEQVRVTEADVSITRWPHLTRNVEFPSNCERNGPLIMLTNSLSIFDYEYRTANCAHWEEDWTERCMLK